MLSTIRSIGIEETALLADSFETLGLESIDQEARVICQGLQLIPNETGFQMLLASQEEALSENHPSVEITNFAPVTGLFVSTVGAVYCPESMDRMVAILEGADVRELDEEHEED